MEQTRQQNVRQTLQQMEFLRMTGYLRAARAHADEKLGSPVVLDSLSELIGAAEKNILPLAQSHFSSRRHR